jgi:glycosyltransferase involved in cell wall biosynthesis
MTELAHPSVQSLGFVADVGRLLRGSDVLVLPTYTEGSALVTYEALASGAVPLVSTAAGAPVLDGGDALVHPTGDAETLANQIRQLDVRRDELARLRRAGLARAPELTWQRAAEQLLHAYEQAITRAPSRG